MGHALERSVERLEQLAHRRYRVAPLCKAPLGTADDYRQLWEEARVVTYPEVDTYERSCGAAIDPEWFHRVGLLTQVVKKRSPICYQHGRLLYATLVRYVRDRNVQHLNIVETGTARGFSALCLARALSETGAAGKIVSFDVLPHDVRIYWNCIRDSDGPRTRAELLGEYADLIEPYLVFHEGDIRRELRKFAFPRIHFAFLDSVHTYEHVLAEFSSIRARQQPGDILFFDDYSLCNYPGVVKAADEICRAHSYTKTVVAVRQERGYLIAEKQ